jgi:hypothetical protein
VDTVGKRDGEIGGDSERKPGLTDAARTGQGQQADLIPDHQVADRGSLSLAADEWRERDWKKAAGLVG